MLKKIRPLALAQLLFVCPLVAFGAQTPNDAGSADLLLAQNPAPEAPPAAHDDTANDVDDAEDFNDFEDFDEFDEFDEFDAFDEDFEEFIAYDPLESINRGIFWFNDKLYFFLMKPVARAYRIVPEPARVCVANFFDNLSAPVRFVNALLQADVNKAGTELSRFLTNSTIGIAGLFDPARKLGDIRRTDEDFGQTLGVWGLGPGMYLMLPIFGPSTLRDGAGRLTDSSISPLRTYVKNPEYWYARGIDTVNTLSLDKDTYEAIKRDALDPYLFVRDAYLQNRAASIGK